MKLVPIELPHSPAHPGGGAMWVNPDHVVSLRPLTTGVEPELSLAVEVKLEGVALFMAPLGKFRTHTASTAAWDGFLSQFVGDEQARQGASSLPFDG